MLQSCPPMVRSRRNELLLITSTLHVSERPRAYTLPLKGRFVPTLTTIFVSLQWTVTENRSKVQRTIV